MMKSGLTCLSLGIHRLAHVDDHVLKYVLFEKHFQLRYIYPSNCQE